MTAAPLSVSDMRANVVKSRGHVAKQEKIIEQLTLQGHTTMAVEAATLLETMTGHLEVEIEMLARIEASINS